MGLSPNARVELLRRNRLEDVQVRLRGDDAQLVGVAEGGDGGQAVGVAKHDALAVLEEASPPASSRGLSAPAPREAEGRPAPWRAGLP
eukprot:CAMPEP_0114319346 /NCGR_PEP_ID=MMETSP0059-20121206/25188_1 /TAXON_ID=36894 /ORGANISM="Pyramimonas parkeae, Strain CCMP726" /LENGTH=87 /DNA_ID=CAMNT_0001446339 /DNA_START=563 /DNA_END=826 /DNA_ORIENTATION=+